MQLLKISQIDLRIDRVGAACAPASGDMWAGMLRCPFIPGKGQGGCAPLLRFGALLGRAALSTQTECRVD
jgi:hypothetical protein